ncbi:hypothetical protein AWB78_05957 [Caballeronia calidae]|uniref:Uncharacterized protein n=1 Tax=Caballeronia calidae TaxID=1777139 RepID=A0A158E0T2_9BURK|nr:hypothetical protein AWB78_05957 [Caballeronia calidae]
MKLRKNGLWARRGRRRLLIAFAALVAALIGIGSGTLRHGMADQRDKPWPATSIVYQMRQDSSPWAHAEKDASRMLADIGEKRVCAIGVALDAIPVSTKIGTRYFVTDRFAVFS